MESSSATSDRINNNTSEQTENNIADETRNILEKCMDLMERIRLTMEMKDLDEKCRLMGILARETAEEAKFVEEVFSEKSRIGESSGNNGKPDGPDNNIAMDEGDEDSEEEPGEKSTKRKMSSNDEEEMEDSKKTKLEF